jgi:hypothetical protein
MHQAMDIAGPTTANSAILDDLVEHDAFVGFLTLPADQALA